MGSCTQVAVFYMAAAIGLFIDQLTLGPLHNLAQHRSAYLTIEIFLLVVSSTTARDWYSLSKSYSADHTLEDLGKWDIHEFDIPAHVRYRAGRLVEWRANRELSCS
jgi:hypothetical protein